ncbi:MAG: valine--tRNA ligase [Candidatus Margulisiibacteriota bacterium]
MDQEIPKVYNPTDVEQKWYKFWEENGFFKPNNLAAKPPFTIVIPPPNITGSLHMGHALNNSIQDLLIRYKRMNGFRALWVPGTDHAGIATQNVVERELKKEGKRKEDLGREKFIEKVWEWKKEYGGKITQQLRRLGASCDWSRERFTMDEGLSRAVRRHFVQLYNEGLIYRGKRIINWCPRCKTAISDIEVQYETKKSHLWHIKYGPITVATTRPETMLGDTAVAINPKDERYKHIWGKTVELPLVGRHIPIIKDDFVDPEFGTGAVKVTPAHDPNDYEMGMRHNLPFINILTPDGHITFNEFSDEEKIRLKDSGIEGLDRFKAREKIVEMLQEKGYLVKIEDYETSIGHCYRCNTVIEPYLSDQWFVKVKPLAEKAIGAVEEGNVKFVPERWTKVYLQWMTNLRDWCISRQLWWGHQVPAWYRGEEMYVGEEPPKGEGWTQDPDVFDTWFSSALWPFSTLGWPDETEDLKTYYPTDVLVTSYDIIFFWVARMIMAGLHFMGKAPFHTVYFNALVKDIHGKKMSKSWGNVIDPLEVIDKAGADALRFAFLSLTVGQGQDVKISEDKITESRNFANKIWNASRFVLMNIDSKIKLGIPDDPSLADKWILSIYNQLIIDLNVYLEKYEFGEAARILYNFIWGEFCDWYIEISKPDLYSQDKSKKEKVLKVLTYVLNGTLKLLHPFMPFITEEIWQVLKEKVDGAGDEKSIMISKWPEADKKKIDPAATSSIEYLKGIIMSVRNIKAELGAQTKEVETVYILPGKDEEVNLKKGESVIKTLGRVKQIKLIGSGKEKPSHSAIGSAFNSKIFVPLEGLADISKELERLDKESQKIVQEIERIKKTLADENFLKNAPGTAVESHKQKIIELEQRNKLLAEKNKELV